MSSKLIHVSKPIAPNYLTLKTVSQLLDKIFYIPDYQRGYRWKAQQVEDLLKDINQFIPERIEKSEKKTWYCLQPLAVKKCSEGVLSAYGLEGRDDCFEVIDGQQRLTTIYLILHYLNLRFVEGKRKTLFEIHYATRENSYRFLKENLNENIIETGNIDFFHMSTAFKTIHNWFTKQNSVPDFDQNEFESKFLQSTKVIWYESAEKDSIALFTRINIGKIPLTNAELIKALFLNSSNFVILDDDEISLKQQEIAQEWDNIEYALQNPSFWYFINEKENNLDTRIELIFNLMADKPEDDKLVSENFTFDYFSKKFINNTKEEVINNWDEIKQFFQILNDWFTDRELYHKIGFLITTGDKIKPLILSLKDCNKREVKRRLNESISRKVRVQLADLSYPQPPVKRILLLHNIQTMLNNKREDSRFPFDRYKTERWDIEHINAIGEEMPEGEKYQQDWLKETIKFLTGNKELKSRAENYVKTDFTSLYREIMDYFVNENGTDETNGIGNLVLLDSKTNRGYKNNVYPVKRSKIIDKDKTGTFIPICTRNVFLKFYSKQVEQMTFWGSTEQQDYYDDIQEVLRVYLPKQSDEKSND